MNTHGSMTAECVFFVGYSVPLLLIVSENPVNELRKERHRENEPRANAVDDADLGRIDVGRFADGFTARPTVISQLFLRRCNTNLPDSFN